MKIDREINQLDDLDLITQALQIRPKPLKSASSFYSSLQSEIIVMKIGTDFNHQTLLIQFAPKDNPRQVKTKRIHIKRFIYKVSVNGVTKSIDLSGSISYINRIILGYEASP